MEFKKIRTAAGMTQKQLSEVTGIPVRTIQNWEGGQRKCPEYIVELVKFRLENLETNENE